MGLFVAAARLNACHSLTEQLGSAESPIGAAPRLCQKPQQTHGHDRRAPRCSPSGDVEPSFSLSLHHCSVHVYV